MPPIAENRTRGTAVATQPQDPHQDPQNLISLQGPDPSSSHTQGHGQHEFEVSSPRAGRKKGDTHGSRSKTTITSTSNSRTSSTSNVFATLDRFSVDKCAALKCMRLEPCLYSPRMLKQAAAIMDSLCQAQQGHDKDRRQSTPAVSAGKSPGSAMPELVFDGAEEKKTTFQLALCAQNYHSVFQEILVDCDFFKLNPTLEVYKPLLTVLMWEYQSRKFQPRIWEGGKGAGKEEKEEEEDELIALLETAILRKSTKLKACLARRRIKASAPKIEFLLPDSVRRRSSSSQRPLNTWAWVNTIKTCMEDVLTTLKEGGFTFLSEPPSPHQHADDSTHGKMQRKGEGGEQENRGGVDIGGLGGAERRRMMERREVGRVEDEHAREEVGTHGEGGEGERKGGGGGVGLCFYMDPHCSDVLVFSADCWPTLQLHPLVKQGHLICQDKSSCLAAHTLIPLTSEHRDVMVVNPGAGWVAGHVAVLVKDRPAVSVVVVSNHKDKEYEKMMTNLQFVGVTESVKVIREELSSVDKDDSRLKNVTAALLIADCSKSAISNIIHYVVTEGEDLKMLSTVTEPEDLDSHLSTLHDQHFTSLTHLLSMSKLWGVAYLTRSIHERENEDVVLKSLEQVNEQLLRKDQQELPAPAPYCSHALESGPITVGGVSHKLLPWMTMAPGLTFSALDIKTCEETDNENGAGGILEDKYIRLSPSEQSNGCFLVCMARTPEDPATVIARARRRGLLGKHHKHKKHSVSTSEDDAADPHNRRGSKDDKSHRRASDHELENMRRGSLEPYACQHAHRRHSEGPAAVAGGGRKGSVGKPSLKAIRRLPSPVRSVTLKDSDTKVPQHQKVVYHPNPFK